MLSLPEVIGLNVSVMQLVGIHAMLNHGFEVHRFQRENKFRTEYSQRVSASLLTFGSPENDYLVHSDKLADGWSTVGGIRLTPGTHTNSDRQIFMFGPCSVIGIFADDEHTIAALLQKSLNRSAEHFRVINCGNSGGFSGASVNELYRMADTGFYAGDIVIHINGDAWCYAFRENLSDKLSLPEIFNSNRAKFSKPFRDSKSCHHLNAHGNEIIAEFLYRKSNITLNLNAKSQVSFLHCFHQFQFLKGW